MSDIPSEDDDVRQADVDVSDDFITRLEDMALTRIVGDEEIDGDDEA